LAISGLEHLLRRNVVPKSPKMARPQDALSAYLPRLPGAEAEAGAAYHLSRITYDPPERGNGDGNVYRRGLGRMRA